MNTQVISADGTAIGYGLLGEGPAVVLIQGAMGSAHNFKDLAAILAEQFKVVVPDRRGRGASPHAYGPDYGVRTEVEDLDALLQATGATRVFGLSSGALIGLAAAREIPSIEKLAIYEPPLFLDAAPTDMLARLEREVAEGRMAAALITGMQGAQLGPSFLNLIPRGALEFLTGMAIARDSRAPGEYVPMRDLAPTLRFDFRLVCEMSATVDTFRDIECDLLLLGGSKSPAYLKAGLDALASAVPRARRVEFAGLNHGAAWNADRGGHPDKVAPALREFLS
ncbi:MAG: hypothetical protein QOK05_954 [Chloroflexota bacterium]|nr:hypothetical protein [Chloroflexota bacterium]